jgi:succinate dehydrogenase flavin-adding protein (antitoxin of CptAB toxin-antitoxin module)
LLLWHHYTSHNCRCSFYVLANYIILIYYLLEGLYELLQKYLGKLTQKSKDEKIAKQVAIRQEELESYTLTSEYNLIKQFVKKNSDNKNAEELRKLYLLLETKGWSITLSELKDLVKKESKIQFIQNAKSKILTNNPTNKDEILMSYLSHYQPNGSELVALEEILKERKLSINNLATLQTNLEKIQKKIELEQYEENLLDDN